MLTFELIDFFFVVVLAKLAYVAHGFLQVTLQLANRLQYGALGISVINRGSQPVKILRSGSILDPSPAIYKIDVTNQRMS